MINYSIKPTVWRATTNSGKRTLLGLVCCFIMVVGSLIISDVHAFDIGDRVVLQNSPNGRNVRNDHRVHPETFLDTIPNGTRGTVSKGPEVDPPYTWYEVEWDTANGVLVGWTADTIDGCPFFIGSAERADQKDAIVERLFKGIPHEATNHDYNDYKCKLSWEGVVGGYIGGHSGWDVQTTSQTDPNRNAHFYALTTGVVIRAKDKYIDTAGVTVIRPNPPNIIAIYGDDGMTTLYLHASEVDVSVGQRVHAGTTRLGRQGEEDFADGAVTGPHVHIEVRKGRTIFSSFGAGSTRDPINIDPIPYFYQSIRTPNPPVPVDPPDPPVVLDEGHTDRVNSVAFSPDGRTIASASNDETIHLWDATTGNHKQTLIEHTRDINDVAFSPDGRIIAGGSDDDNIYLWDATTGRLLQTLEEHTNTVNSVAFSSDGRTIASASNDDTVCLWDATTGDHKWTIEHTKDINDVAFSPDGRIIAGGSDDDNIYLWDATTGEDIQTFEGHTDRVNSVAFSPDGRTIVSGSEDDTVRLWDVATGEDIQTFEGHNGWIESVAFSPDGRTIASGGDDDTVRIWRVDVEIIEPLPLAVPLAVDVNADGVVTIQDLVLVALSLGKTGENAADVNNDGFVDIQDLVLVAGALENTVAGAPFTWYRDLEDTPTKEQVQKWLTQAQKLNLTDAISQRGIRFLEQLLMAVTPKKTVLLPNYPNPFNPETWIPYHLAKDADVTLHIYAVNGTLVRTLTLRHQTAGMYQNRSRAAYWDGRNALGELVASGVYFYTLTAGEFTATRKMLIAK